MWGRKLPHSVVNANGVKDYPAWLELWFEKVLGALELKYKKLKQAIKIKIKIQKR